MAVKKVVNSGRKDPKKNKSLALRLVLKKMWNSPATAVIETVKKEYGHQVKPNMVYMIKTKMNMASRKKESKPTPKTNGAPLTTPAMWVHAIKLARQLLKEAGNVDNAVSLLKAVDG